MILYLCSDFTTGKDKLFKDLDNTLSGKHMLYIPTAANAEEDYFPSDNEHMLPFQEIGMSTEKLDIDKVDENTFIEALNKADLLYIGGGNSFYLLEHLQRLNAKDHITEKLLSGMIYVGSSAGSIVLCKNIDFIALMDAPEKATLSNKDGLGLVPFNIVPHLDSPYLQNEAKEILALNKERKEQVFALYDNQIITINDNNLRVL